MMQGENFLIYILINEVYHSLFTSHLLEPRKVPRASTHAHTFPSQLHCFTVPIHPNQVLYHCPVV